MKDDSKTCINEWIADDEEVNGVKDEPKSEAEGEE